MVQRKRKKKLHHQRRSITSSQPMLKTSQTTWTLTIQHSHNQSVLVLVELHSMLNKNHQTLFNKHTIITTIINTEILVMRVSMRPFMDLLLAIRASSHSHGEESRRHIQLMDQRTHLGNGQIKLHWLNTNIITITRAKILETKESMRPFMDLLPATRVSSHSHGEESRRHTQLMDQRTDLGNGLTKQMIESCQPSITEAAAE